MYTCEVVLKTAQATGESGGFSRNHWEIGGIQGKFRGNWGRQNSLASGKLGGNEGKLFHKNLWAGALG